MMICNIHVGFYEPWQKMYMTGSVRRTVNSYEECEKLVASYEKYYKDTYGEDSVIVVEMVN